MDFNPQSYAPDGTAVFANDAQLLVKFFKHPVISQYQSNEKGRPVYDDVIMVSVIQPGEKEKVEVLANDWHKARFPKQWDSFQKGVEAAVSGTPLDMLFPAEPSAILTLKSFNVFTVEQLASLTDSAIANMPMGRALVDRAKRYLDTATGGSEFHHMQKRIAELEAKLADQAEGAAAAPSTPRRGPGRPPKAQEGQAT